jgi:hypothetical protein
MEKGGRKMENRNFIFVLIVLTVTLGSLSFVGAVESACSPTIKLVNQDPLPAIPNDYVKIVFEVSGLVNPACKGMSVKLTQEYPFSLDSGDSGIQSISDATYSQGYKNVWNVPYKLRVAQDALEGDYLLKLYYYLGTDGSFDTNHLEKDFNITITDVQTDFAVVVQDSSGTQVSLGIVNTGKNTANSLVVGIPQQESFRATGTSQQIVGNLAAGDYTIVSFAVSPIVARNFTRNMTGGQQPFNPNINASGQQFNLDGQTLKIKMDYTDGIGKRRSVVREVQFNVQQGNLTSRIGAAGRTGTTSTASGISHWWYLLGITVLVIIGVYIKKNYGNEIKNFAGKNQHKKSSGNAPGWVSAERTHKKSR